MSKTGIAISSSISISIYSTVHAYTHTYIHPYICAVHIINTTLGKYGVVTALISKIRLYVLVTAIILEVVPPRRTCSHKNPRHPRVTLYIHEKVTQPYPKSATCSSSRYFYFPLNVHVSKMLGWQEKRQRKEEEETKTQEEKEEAEEEKECEKKLKTKQEDTVEG